jgi:hypothetical protein
MVIEHLIHTKPLLVVLVIGLLAAANVWLWRHAPSENERGGNRPW